MGTARRIGELDAIPFLALTAAAALTALLVARLRPGRTVRSPEAITVVAVAAALIGATTAALAANAASSDGWTAARQVGLSVTGRETCGIADDVQIPDSRSVERLDPWPREVRVRADQRTIASTTGSRWYQVPDERVGTFIRGDWNNQRLVVSWAEATVSVSV